MDFKYGEDERRRHSYDNVPRSAYHLFQRFVCFLVTQYFDDRSAINTSTTRCGGSLSGRNDGFFMITSNIPGNENDRSMNVMHPSILEEVSAAVRSGSVVLQVV